MDIIENKTFDEERALYGREGIRVVSCAFDGPADGESAFKECTHVETEDCFFNLRYPFWHVDGLIIRSGHMTELCRAALWYSTDIAISDSKLHGIKALRECSGVNITGCDIISQEFGWSSGDVTMESCRVQSEYFLLRARDIRFRNVDFSGKYSFQYVENAVLENCRFDTKDAFWHAENVTVKNSVIKGEYLAWYSKNLTLIDCTIIGTQPFCYCEGLRLVNCRMEGTDLCFEKSDVDAEIITPVISVKNPRSGCVRLPEVGQIIMDDSKAAGQIIVTGAKNESV